jgi:hypothetical protein
MGIALERPTVTEGNADGGVDLEVSDVTGHNTIRVRDFPREATVGDLVNTLVDRMQLSATGSGGETLTYHARFEQEARHLHASEIVGDALQPGRRISLQPNIDAG